MMSFPNECITENGTRVLSTQLVANVFALTATVTGSDTLLFLLY